jgi:anti-sigma-K factor RskA
MNDESIHALSGAYAVDALDDLERARFEAHLSTCADCRAEVAGLRETARLLAETTPTAPPPALRERVLADITRVRPLPPAAPGPAVPAHAGPHRRWGRLLTAAAAVLALVGIGTVTTHPWEHGTQQASVADRVLHAGDAQRVSATLPGGARATVVRSVSQGRAVIVTRNMPAAPSGKVYELWLEDRAGTMRPAGLMQGGSRTVVLRGDAATAKAAGVTVEPAGGSRRPTSAPIALFAFSEAGA